MSPHNRFFDSVLPTNARNSRLFPRPVRMAMRLEQKGIRRESGAGWTTTGKREKTDEREAPWFRLEGTTPAAFVQWNRGGQSSDRSRSFIPMRKMNRTASGSFPPIRTAPLVHILPKRHWNCVPGLSASARTRESGEAWIKGLGPSGIRLVRNRAGRRHVPFISSSMRSAMRCAGSRSCPTLQSAA